MTQKSYDAGLFLGTSMLFGGSVALWDWPHAFVIAGATVIALTLIGAVLGVKR